MLVATSNPDAWQAPLYFTRSLMLISTIHSTNHTSPGFCYAHHTRQGKLREPSSRGVSCRIKRQGGGAPNRYFPHPAEGQNSLRVQMGLGAGVQDDVLARTNPPESGARKITVQSWAGPTD